MAFSDLLAAGDGAVLTQLGAPVLYTPGVGSPVTVTGIFDAVAVLVDAGRAGVSSHAPMVWLRLADLTSDPESDGSLTVTVADVVYQPREVRKDGTGGVQIFLHRVT